MTYTQLSGVMLMHGTEHDNLSAAGVAAEISAKRVHKHRSGQGTMTCHARIAWRKTSQ